MKVFRLCTSDEIENILAFKSLRHAGQMCYNDPTRNDHQYEFGKKYMHFFGDERQLLYLSPKQGHNVCVYDIPDNVLKESKGYGIYLNFINMRRTNKVPEFAVPTDKMKLDYLKSIYLVTGDIDFDYLPEKEEIYDCLTCMVDVDKIKNKSKDDDIEK